MEEIPAKQEEAPKVKKTRAKAPATQKPKAAPKTVHPPRVRRNKPLDGSGRTGVGSRTIG